MVDCSLDSISTIKFNATHTKLIDKSTILKADVFATIKKLHLKQTKFDIKNIISIIQRNRMFVNESFHTSSIYLLRG